MKKAVDDTTDDLDKFKSQANDKFQNLGNMSCQVSKGGIQNYINSWLNYRVSVQGVESLGSHFAIFMPGVWFLWSKK